MTNSMTKFLAEEKLLEEVNQPHDATTDIIHNWLCDQDDDAIFDGIVEDGKTIAGAIAYCGVKAQESAESGARMAMIDQDTVFSWVKTYFSDPEIEVDPKPVARVQSLAKTSTEASETSKVIANPNNSQSQPKPKPKAKKGKGKHPAVLDGQLDMFADLGLDL